MALGVVVSLDLEGEVGATAFERLVAGVMAKGFLVNQEVLFRPTAVGIALVHDVGEVYPC